MARYRLTSKVEADLLDIWSALAEQSKADAAKLIQSFHQQFPLLAEHAQLGQARPDIRADVRCFPVKRDLILSRQRPDGIKVVRVIHVSSDLDALFETGDSDESPATTPPSLVRDSISGDDGWLHTKEAAFGTRHYAPGFTVLADSVWWLLVPWDVASSFNSGDTDNQQYFHHYPPLSINIHHTLAHRFFAPPDGRRRRKPLASAPAIPDHRAASPLEGRPVHAKSN